jgi:hypothetical protein
MAEKIVSAGWEGCPPDEVMSSLSGAVLNVMVGGEISASGTRWSELFRYARVTNVLRRPPELHAACCRCQSEARWEFTVEWEAGYVSPDGDVVCEGCVSGLVTSGHQDIEFCAAPKRSA